MKEMTIFRKVTCRAATFCALSCMFVVLLTALFSAESFFEDYARFVAAFVIWTLPFVLIFSVTISVLVMLISRPPLLLRYMAVIPLGLGIAYLWASVPIGLLGPWALNLPSLLPAWIVGAISGSVAAVGTLTSQTKQNRIVGLFEWILPIALSLVAVFGSAPIYSGITGYRDIRLTFVHWQPGPGASIIEDPLSHLTEQEAIQLRALQLGGNLREESTVEVGTGLPQVHVMIIMRRPLDQSIRLSFPDSGSIIYVQEDDGWHAVPPGTRTTQRAVQLYQDSHQNTLSWIELPNGAKSSGGGISWRQ